MRGQVAELSEAEWQQLILGLSIVFRWSGDLMTEFLDKSKRVKLESDNETFSLLKLISVNSENVYALAELKRVE